MKVLNIIKGTFADGPGLRNSVYVAGCHHHCPGCHNPASWCFDSGVEMGTNDIYKEIIDPYSNITISGGDPMAPEHIDEILELVKLIRQKNPDKNIWVYTGYTIEELIQSDTCVQILKNIDTLVDGRYIQNLRDTRGFRGSSNQRIINLREYF